MTMYALTSSSLCEGGVKSLFKSGSREHCQRSKNEEAQWVVSNAEGSSVILCKIRNLRQ
jgi:hypothetical protein